MFGISTKAGGLTQAMPDVCKVPAPPAPPIPTPFPNIAQCQQANASTCTKKVKIGNKAVLTMKSEIPVSSGNEAGSVGGVVSGKIKGEAVPKKGSAKVKIEGSPAIYHTCLFGQNGKNANAPAGVQMLPSQTKVVVLG
ncbi:MAG: DUF4150 domain-containing protein [Gammaproteobacteria bacterium]|nr:DUF4150 domain-containing protein [Gammaproteobacteria bacterium]